MQSGNNLPHYGVTYCLHLLPCNINNSKKKVLTFATFQHLACFSTHTKFHLSSQITSFVSSSLITSLFSLFILVFTSLPLLYFFPISFVCLSYCHSPSLSFLPLSFLSLHFSPFRLPNTTDHVQDQISYSDLSFCFTFTAPSYHILLPILYSTQIHT